MKFVMVMIYVLWDLVIFVVEINFEVLLLFDIVINIFEWDSRDVDIFIKCELVVILFFSFIWIIW